MATIPERLLEIERMEAGWFDGYGPSYRGFDIDRVANTLARILGSVDLPDPGVFPDQDECAVSAEWNLSDHMPSISFASDGKLEGHWTWLDSEGFFTVEWSSPDECVRFFQWFYGR